MPFVKKYYNFFRFEANVPAGFNMLDDIERATLLSGARDRTLDRAISERGALLEALTMLARHASGKAFDLLIEEFLRHRVFSGVDKWEPRATRTLYNVG